MGKKGYFVEIVGVHERKAFFRSVLSFFAPVDATLTTWGKLPSNIYERISPFRAPCLWLRRLFFHEANWQLNPSSLQVLLESLCVDELLNHFTWGIRKGNTPLALCRHWKNDITIDQAEFIEDLPLLNWLEDMKEKEIIGSYEKSVA